jgi:RNA polymerase sigma-32 factor
VRDDQNDELINFIPESKASVELLLGNEQEAKIKKLLLKEAMATLNPREVEILTCRRLREVPVTLDVLSKKFDLSKERIRQLENRAVAKLQEYVLKKINQDCSLLPPS